MLIIILLRIYDNNRKYYSLKVYLDWRNNSIMHLLKIY